MDDTIKICHYMAAEGSCLTSATTWCNSFRNSVCETNSSISLMQGWRIWRQLSLSQTRYRFGFQEQKDFSRCFSRSIWPMSRISLPCLCHLLLLSLPPLHTYSNNISWSTVFKYANGLLDRYMGFGPVLWSALKEGWLLNAHHRQLLYVNAVHSNTFLTMLKGSI